MSYLQYKLHNKYRRHLGYISRNEQKRELIQAVLLVK
jgi:hypothetical protein